MKATTLTTAEPLTHLTALHLLGRILERLDHKAGPNHHSRYQLAMRHLSDALDRVEQAFVVRQVIEANPARARK